ncbi:hypothetical protein [Streptomyces sp.]|uniref:hypothetical protein n=1 Tax=Streptomyces sp. TaxID=1931 RepID=UPI002F947E50
MHRAVRRHALPGLAPGRGVGWIVGVALVALLAVTAVCGGRGGPPCANGTPAYADRVAGPGAPWGTTTAKASSRRLVAGICGWDGRAVQP